MQIKFKVESRLITWNEVAHMAYSKDSNNYSRTKKRQQTFIKHEIAQQVVPENYFGDSKVSVSYDWHTSTKFDLGNIAAGEKFLADSINELKLWDDDFNIVQIIHRRIVDDENYVLVTINEVDD